MPTLEWIGKSKVVNHHLEVPYHLTRSISEQEGFLINQGFPACFAVRLSLICRLNLPNDTGR